MRSPTRSGGSSIKVLVVVLALSLSGCGDAEPGSPAPEPAAPPAPQQQVTQATAPPTTVPAPSVTAALTTAPAETTTTGAPPRTPLETGEAWLAAFENGDVAAFQALMHPDAIADCINCGYEREETPYFGQIGEGTADVSDSRLLALANGSLDVACVADDDVVTCTTLRSSDFGYVDESDQPSRQLDATYEFTVHDGLVTRRILTIHSGHTFDFGVVAAYERWLRDNQPDAHAELFAFGTILLTTDEQFVAHQMYVPRFLETR